MAAPCCRRFAFGIADKSPAKTAAEKQPQRRPVDIVAYHPMIKLVNNIDKVSLLQTHPVGELYEPRILNIYIVDNANNVVPGQRAHQL